MMSIILLSCYFALAAGSPMTASVQSMAAVPCETDKDCKTQVDAYSTCRFPAGLCSTNAYEQGCLYRHGASDKIRVCNSEDGPTAAEEGLCRIADIEYSEVRLFSNDWESAIFETWILQIVLSELLNVPTTTESGVYGAKNDFYNAHSSIRFGDSDFLPAMTTAARITDCREARKDPQNYTPCAHVVSEVWHASEAAVLLKNGSAKPPLSLGVLGQEALFVPKFTGERDPTLLSYMGLQGEKNRQKLADRFLRPATWREYCAEASNSSCQVADEVAARPPQNDKEFDRYYVDDLYTGFFRRTEENDCEKWPDNCTGHVVDYPCTWTSYLDQNAYHLGMALQSNGPDARSGKYTYEEMMEVWTAANHTKSDVMMMWWYPSTLYQTYLGTDAEFLKVNLPPPMQECMKNRVLQEDQCSSNIKTRVGNASGACDEAAKPLLTITSTGFFNMIYNPLIPNPLQSPAYDAVKGFQLSSTQLGEIFSYWFNARDAREGVCQ